MWRRRLSQFAVAVIPVVGVGEIVAHFYFAGRAPPFDAWGQVVGPVDVMREPDDLLVVAPRWAEPLARRALGDVRMPLVQVARSDTRRFAGALEISILGERDGELAEWREVAKAESGPFTLRRVLNPGPEPVLVDFVDRADPGRLEVTVVGGSGPSGQPLPASPCPFTDRASVSAGNLGGHPTFPARRFQCPGGKFMNVSATVIADERFLPRRCLFAHPPLDGRSVELRFSDVQLGERLVGHGGIDWMVERELAGAPVELEVRVDGESVGRYAHRDGDGWSEFDLPLGVHAGARAAEVVFSIHTSDPRHRHFCFEATSR